MNLDGEGLILHTTEDHMKKTLCVLMISIGMLSACVTKDNDPDVHTSATLARFRVDEIQNYQGKLLDPAIGPRDNSIAGVQHLDINEYTLTIKGLIGAPVELSYDDVLQFTPNQRLITLYCVEGWEATILWEGVLLSDLIALANPGPEVTTIIFHSSDGYTTSLPYQTIKDKQLILAYKSNGLDLPDEMGYPFIVVAQDKLGYKWARWVTEIELSTDENYKGYWESRGYTNSADVD
jgi:DMSO/TMAO reductase YedYZ molybdopterin-dependent catalytic subunit